MVNFASHDFKNSMNPQLGCFSKIFTLFQIGVLRLNAKVLNLSALNLKLFANTFLKENSLKKFKNKPTWPLCETERHKPQKLKSVLNPQFTKR